MIMGETASKTPCLIYKLVQLLYLLLIYKTNIARILIEVYLDFLKIKAIVVFEKEWIVGKIHSFDIYNKASLS